MQKSYDFVKRKQCLTNNTYESHSSSITQQTIFLREAHIGGKTAWLEQQRDDDLLLSSLVAKYYQAAKYYQEAPFAIAYAEAQGCPSQCETRIGVFDISISHIDY